MLKHVWWKLPLCSQEHLIPGAYKFDALITTFEMILSDCPELREISWRCVIIDEAHRLKNRNCKLLDSLKMLDLVSGPQMIVDFRTKPRCSGKNTRNLIQNVAFR